MHQVLHLDSEARAVNGDFDITTESTWNDYTKSLLPIPILCAAIGLLGVFIFQMSACCYCCCKKRPVVPATRDSNASNIPLRNCWITFLFFLVAVLVYDQSLIFGNQYLGNGVSTVNDGLDYLETTFTTLNNDGDVLNTYGVQLLSDFENSVDRGCASSPAFVDSMDDYFSYINEYTSYVEDVPGQCADAQDAVHRYAVDYRDKTVWVFYGMFLVCLVIYLCGMAFSNKPVLFTGMCVTDLVMIFSFIICGTTMIILILVADFCMEPSDNLIMIAPDDVSDVTTYYTKCIGQNPMQPSLDDAEQLVHSGRQAVNDALLFDATCANDPFLQDALLVFNQIDIVFVHIQALIACPPNQAEVLSVLNDGMCGDTFKGVFVIWLGMFACAGGLFFMSVAAACAFPYFANKNSGESFVDAGNNSPLRPSGSAPAEEEVSDIITLV